MKVDTEKEITIYYDYEEIGLHRLDLIVENEIIVELKAVKIFDKNYKAQIISYLKATGLKIGLLLNFGKTTLDIKKFIN